MKSLKDASHIMDNTEVIRVSHKWILWLVLIVGVILSPIATESLITTLEVKQGYTFLQQIITATRTTSKPIIIADGDFNILHCNNRAAAFVKAPSRHELRKHNATDLIPKEFKEEHEKAVNLLKDGTVGAYDIKCKMKLMDGTLKDVEVHIDYGSNKIGNRIYIATWDDEYN